MKRIVFILSLLVLILGSCGQSQKKAEEAEVVQSDIRPGEELVLDKVYTDKFEYVECRDGEYRDLLDLTIDNRDIVLYIDEDCEGWEIIRDLNPCDIVEIDWRLERFYHDGGGQFYLGEFAQRITKIED